MQQENQDNLHAVYHRHGPPESMEMIREAPPEPGPGEIRIRVETAGVSPADLLMGWGLHPEARRCPFTPGWDVIGIIDQVGTDVNDEECGKRVAALTIVGGFAKYVRIPAEDAVAVPEGLDPAAAQCLPFDYVVSYQMLHRTASLKPGATILVQGAAGSTGSALLQLGAAMGLKMYGTASTRKLGIVQEMGGIPIDYTCEDFVEVLREKEPDGIDAAFDGLGHTALRSYKVLNEEGLVVMYGHAPVVSGGKRDWGKLVVTAAQFALVFLHSTFSSRKAQLYSIQEMKKNHPDWYKEDLSELFRLLGEGVIKPLVYDSMSLERAPEAMDLVNKSAATGKIVLFARD